jgi:ribosome maturation factor RimP
MNMTPQIQVLETMIQEALAAHPEHFLVDLTVKPGNNIKLHIDGDTGISIEKLVQYNRSLYKQIEEGGLFPEGDFALEVSSPGLDEPLKLHRQYVKNKGRKVELILTDGSRKEGKLLDVNETELLLEEEKGRDASGKPTGKKKELVQQTIPFSNIKTTKVQVTF